MERYYAKHVFLCENQREDGGKCCGNFNARGMRDYAKKKMKDLGEHGKGKVRINGAACLARCDEGPVMVVYPEGVWYSYVDEEDIDDIINEHLLNGRIVERLQLSND